MNLTHTRRYETPYHCPICGNVIHVTISADEGYMEDACAPQPWLSAPRRTRLRSILQDIEVEAVEYGADHWLLDEAERVS